MNKLCKMTVEIHGCRLNRIDYFQEPITKAHFTVFIALETAKRDDFPAKIPNGSCETKSDLERKMLRTDQPRSKGLENAEQHIEQVRMVDSQQLSRFSFATLQSPRWLQHPTAGLAELTPERNKE